MHDRKASLSKASFTSDSARKEWEDVLTVELMSSEESDVDEEGKEILIVHQIPWLSDTVNTFKRTLDAQALKLKSPQSVRQMKKRIEGRQSSRPPPAAGCYPDWIF